MTLRPPASVLVPYTTLFRSRAVGVGVVHPAVAVDRDPRVGLVDCDGSAAIRQFIVGVARKCPGGGAAGYVGEGRTKIQQSSQVFAFHTGGVTRGAVRISVVD